MTIGQWFARVTATTVVRSPRLWRLFKGTLVRNFDRLAPEWNTTHVSADRLTTISAVFDAIDHAPRTVLDVGTGSGAVARLAASRWPDAVVNGVDASSGMIAEARRLAESDREVYEVADASALPFSDAAFELVAQNNMIPFFDELARVTAPGGQVAVAFSRGASTPIWVPLERIRRELAARNFSHFADFSIGLGRGLLARKGDRS